MQLSIAVPTYNRSEILQTWLSKHTAMLYRHNVDIYISDNKSTDTTSEIVQEWSKNYKNIFYSRTNETLKAEYNFERCVNLAGKGWVWMVGDSYEITEETLIKVKALLKSKSDYIILNLLRRSKYECKGEISLESAVGELSGILSCISCVIYNVDRLGEITLSEKEISFYPHMLNIYKGIYEKGNKAEWHKDISIEIIRFKTPRKNWSNTTRVYEIAVDGWIWAIDSIQGVDQKTKHKAYKQFSKISGLFKFSGILWLRAQNLIDKKIFIQYQERLKKVSTTQIFAIKIITLIPANILLYIYKIRG